MAQPDINGTQIDTGTAIDDLVQLVGVGSPTVAGLPAVDGSQLLNLPLPGGVSGDLTMDPGAQIFLDTGDVTNPSIAFTNNTNTGMFLNGGSPSALAFASGGQESLNIEVDGTLNVAAVTNYETLVTFDDAIPNKKYVDDQDAVYVPLTINEQTGTSYTLVLTDAGIYVRMTNAAANTVTVPPNSAVAFEIGTEIVVRQAGAGTTTIVEGSGVTVNTVGGSPKALSISEQHTSLSLIKVATDEWDLAGSVA